MPAGPLFATTLSNENWVARRPLGFKASSYARVTARAALRRLKQVQFSGISTSMALSSLWRKNNVKCRYTY
jgi:hypothetical protein